MLLLDTAAGIQQVQSVPATLSSSLRWFVDEPGEMAAIDSDPAWMTRHPEVGRSDADFSVLIKTINRAQRPASVPFQDDTGSVDPDALEIPAPSPCHAEPTQNPGHHFSRNLTA